MTLTEEQIAEIRARAEAATPGPWAYESVSEKSNDYRVGVVFPVDEDGTPADPILGNVKHHPHNFNAETGEFGEWGCEQVCSIDEGEHSGDGTPYADAAFIAHARTDIPALLSALESARSANRPRDDYPVFCSDCGRAHVLDTVLPSEIWNKIASPDDLLCVVCIDTRLKKAGLTAEAEFYYSGDALRSRLYGDADALEACGTTEAIEAVAASLSGTPSPIPGDTTK